MKNVFFHPSFKDLFKKYPIILLDVGASGGVQRIWRKAKEFLQVVGFEPDKRAFDGLRKTEDRSQKFINEALHSFEGTAKLNFAKKQTCSSVFAPNFSLISQFPDADRYSIVDTSDIHVRPLTKNILSKNNIKDADFLKLDTQGCDLDILKGATEVVDRYLFGIEVEVEFSPIYINQPLFSDVDIFLQEHGFQLFDLKRYYWKREVNNSFSNKKGQIIFADALYFKTYESLYNSIIGMDVSLRKIKILKALSICLIYNKVDYAAYLADRANRDGILDSADLGVILKRLSDFKISFTGKLKNIIKILKNSFIQNAFYHADEDLDFD